MQLGFESDSQEGLACLLCIGYPRAGPGLLIPLPPDWKLLEGRGLCLPKPCGDYTRACQTAGAHPQAEWRGSWQGSSSNPQCPQNHPASCQRKRDPPPLTGGGWAHFMALETKACQREGRGPGQLCRAGSRPVLPPGDLTGRPPQLKKHRGSTSSVWGRAGHWGHSRGQAEWLVPLSLSPVWAAGTTQDQEVKRCTPVPD